MSDIIKINYYDAFKCTADQCSFTCCKEWKIGVDEKTLEKWQDKKLDSISDGGKLLSELKLTKCVKEAETGSIIALKKDRNCPFLNDKKLCRLVLELGEDFLSETCTTFPRQINTFDDRIEYSLDASCPAVVDLFNQKIGTTTFYKEGNQTSKPLSVLRDKIIEMIEEEAYSLPERMMMIFYSLLDLLDQKSITVTKVKDYMNKEHLQPVAEAIRKMPFNLFDSFTERNELFLDIVDNYRKQKLYVDYLEGIAVKGEEIEEGYSEEIIVEKETLFETQILPYENLFKNYLVGEIFANCLLPDMSLEDMVVAFQWITLEYSVMRQAIFLKWHTEGEQEINYEMVRDYITVISRVTGYDQSDIKEYLANSFESLVWEWGYLALIVGNGKV